MKEKHKGGPSKQENGGKPASGKGTKGAESSARDMTTPSLADLKQRYLEKLKGKKSSAKSPTTTAGISSAVPPKTPASVQQAGQKKSGVGKQSSKEGRVESQLEQQAAKRKADGGSVETQTTKKLKKEKSHESQQHPGGGNAQGENRKQIPSDAKKGAPVPGSKNGRPDAEAGQKRKKAEAEASPSSVSGTPHHQKQTVDHTVSSKVPEKPLFSGKKKYKVGEEKTEVAKSGRGERKKIRDSVDVLGDSKHKGDSKQQTSTTPSQRSPFAKATAADGGGAGKGKEKGKDKKKEGKSGGGESERGDAEGVGEGEGLFPFEVDPADHAETPAEAYQDIAPVLALLAEAMGKAPATLKVYDPYFCDGGVTRRLRRHGFTSVYNRREDFYKVIEAGKVPPHDVVLTNPPYSADHMEKILNFVCASGKPWLLLVPNFVYTKDYYERTALDMSKSGKSGLKPPMYLIPNKRYTYWTPPWLHQTKFGESTSPFPSFWFLQLGKYADAVAQKFLKLPPKQTARVALARGIEELPNEVRAAFDPHKKRKSSKARKRLAKQRAEKRVHA